MKPLYRRILLKLSGEALAGEGGGQQGLAPEVLARMAVEIREVVERGVQVGIVVGGGNLFRGAALVGAGLSRVTGDTLGMLATVMNALALQDVLERHALSTQVMSALPLPTVCESFNARAARAHLEAGRVVICAAGTGNPFFTTDSAAALRAIEIGAEVMLKATKVDGVYDRDPVRDPAAVRFSRLSYDEVLARRLGVMDLTAIVLCRDHGLPVRVFNMNQPGALYRAVTDPEEGTLVAQGDNP
ncbi:UMP kinase [Gammaproteobacteria bacterium]